MFETNLWVQDGEGIYRVASMVICQQGNHTQCAFSFTAVVKNQPVCKNKQGSSSA